MDTIPDMIQDTIIRQDTVYIADTIKPAKTVVLTGDSSTSSDTIVFYEEITSEDSGSKIERVDRIDIIKNDSLQKSVIINEPAKPIIVLKPEILKESRTVSITETPGKDSLVETAVIKSPVFSESVLAETRNNSSDPGNHTFQDFIIAADWQFYLLMGTFVLVAWMQSVFGSILLKTYQAAISFAVTLRMYKDNSVLQKQLDNILIGLYFLSVSYYLLLLESKFQLYPYELHGFVRYLFNIGILLLIFYVRSILMILTGILFNQRALFDEYHYNISVFNKLTGLILLPFILLLNYSEGIVQNTLLWISLALVGSVILMRLFRGFIFSVKKGVLILYLFLYLCALELVPVMVIFKWIQSIV